MKKIFGRDIKDALSKTYRVYLCGNLSKPQVELPCISDDNLEIGMSYYKEFTSDNPHFHTRATEYNFILEGESRVFLPDEINGEQEYHFEKGGMFVLSPNTRYAFKHKAGTKILFIKCPGGNDKMLFKPDEKLKAWLSSWEVMFPEA